MSLTPSGSYIELISSFLSCFASNQFFQKTNWFWIFYFECKIIPFNYAIWEKKCFKGFCSWGRGFNDRGWYKSEGMIYLRGEIQIWI